MPTLFRKRVIPEECLCLDEDTILACGKDYLITAWMTIKPKAAFSQGVSYYDMKNGWKISRLYRDDGELAYIYCDIIQTEYDSARDSYIFTDLLADVIVENNGAVRVVDLDELADAFQQQLITAEQLTDALHQLDHLLALIYSDGLEQYFEKMKQALSPIEKDSSQ